MASRRLIYSDGLQNDNDINIVLQAFNNLHVNVPPTPTTSLNAGNPVRTPAGSSSSIISISDSDTDSDSSPINLTVYTEPDALYHSDPDTDSDSSPFNVTFSHDDDQEDTYWRALNDADSDAFWAEASALLIPEDTGTASTSNTTEESPPSSPSTESLSSAQSVGSNESNPLNAEHAEDGESNYLVSAGGEIGVLRSWHRAGHASQGVPGASVRRLVQIQVPPRQRGRKAAYVVYEGRVPGIYTVWSDAKAQVTRVSGNVYQGFSSLREAERAYILVYAMGCVRSLPVRQSPVRAFAPAMLDAFNAVSDDFLDAAWHVVFKGKTPGVYPAWNFAASQTKGVSCAIYKRYESRAAAQAAFDLAHQRGETAVLQ